MPSSWPLRDHAVSFLTSSFCTDGGCVGVAADGAGAILIADTKAPGPVLRLSHDEWRGFVTHAKAVALDTL